MAVQWSGELMYALHALSRGHDFQRVLREVMRRYAVDEAEALEVVSTAKQAIDAARRMKGAKSLDDVRAAIAAAPRVAGITPGLRVEFAYKLWPKRTDRTFGWRRDVVDVFDEDKQALRLLVEMMEEILRRHGVE